MNRRVLVFCGALLVLDGGGGGNGGAFAVAAAATGRTSTTTAFVLSSMTAATTTQNALIKLPRAAITTRTTTAATIPTTTMTRKRQGKNPTRLRLAAAATTTTTTTTTTEEEKEEKEESTTTSMVTSKTLWNALQELESLTNKNDDDKNDEDKAEASTRVLPRLVQLLQWMEDLEQSPQGLQELWQLWHKTQPPQVQKRDQDAVRRRRVTTNDEDDDDNNDGSDDNIVGLLRQLVASKPQEDATSESSSSRLPSGSLLVDDDKDDNKKAAPPKDDTLELEQEEDEYGRLTKLKRMAGVAGLSTLALAALREAWRNARPIPYQTYENHKEFPNVDLSSTLMKHCRGTPPSQYFFSSRKLYRWCWRYLRARLAQMLSSSRTNRALTYQDKQQVYFSKRRLVWGLLGNPLQQLLPQPPVLKKTGWWWWFCWPFSHGRLEQWERDEELTRQYWSGAHPVMICRCKNVTAELTPQLIDFVTLEKLQGLANESRLLYANYLDLEKLQSNPLHEAFPPVYNQPPKNRVDVRCVDPAFILMELEPRQRQELKILAIQLNVRRNDTAKTTTTPQIFSPETTKDPHEWLMAKLCVQVADAQYHQWVSHLGKTHLAVEPHLIAIHNTLKRKNHPLYVFFQPLVKDTLYVNWAARQELISFGENAFGDYFSSVGVGQGMQLISQWWQSYSFLESSGVPSELASRGFLPEDDFPSYHYRTDALQLWNAMGDFAKDFVGAVYPYDEDVVGDAILQEWARETTAANKANVPGFPTSFSNRTTLTQVLQTFLWMTSGLHAAVSSPQYDYMAFTPNKPLSLRRGMYDYQTEGRHAENPREWIFRLALPYVTAAKRTAVMTHLWTLPSETCLDNLHDHFRDTVGERAYTNFVAKLDEIGNEVEQRNRQNKRRGKPIYHYLHPSVVPASIDT